MQRNNITRIKLFSLLLLFAVPMVVGWVLFHYHDLFQFKTTNHGMLVHPAVFAKELSFKPSAHNTWQIIYAPAACDEQAQNKMFTLHQLHTALGKNQQRVSLTWVTNATCKQDAHDFRKLILNKQQLAQLKTALSNQKDFTVNDKIYLLDPIGNLFMYYDSSTNPMNILKDIKKVLEVSQIG